MAAESDIRIFDTTLRDGEQTPGVAFAVADKVRVAKKLDDMGVHVIEAGFPVNSQEEAEAVRQIAEEVDTQVCGLARAIPKDIEAAIGTGVDMVHVFISTSGIQMEKSMHITNDAVLEKTRTSVKHVKDEGKVCMYSPMDATRTDPEFLIEACGVAKEAGADVINLPDTVGIGTPAIITEMVDRVKKAVDIPLSIHCHNDFGMAGANTMAAALAGAKMLQVTLNGIGERAGNAPFEEVVMGLRCLHGIKIGIRTEMLYEASRLIETLTGIPVTPNKPIVGANAFSHESGIHAAGVIEDPRTFEPGVMGPEMVGHRRRLVVGKHTGRHSVQKELEVAGIAPTEDELMEIVHRVKSLGGKGKRVTSTDLYAIAEAVMENVPTADRALVLDQIIVTTGNKLTPTASVTARMNGETCTEAQTGVGPVDAALKAVQRIVGMSPHLEICEFHIDAMTGGADAVAHVSLAVEDEEGRRTSAHAAHEDIVIASVEALVTAVNHLVRVRRSSPETVGAL
jgi:2-isopropylmalate synthase